MTTGKRSWTFSMDRALGLGVAGVLQPPRRLPIVHDGREGTAEKELLIEAYPAYPMSDAMVRNIEVLMRNERRALKLILGEILTTWTGTPSGR